MMETPLVDDFASLKDAVPPYPPAFDAYIDAEYLSIKASESMAPLEQFVNPLVKVKDRLTLDKMWKEVDRVCPGSSFAACSQTEFLELMPCISRFTLK